MAIWIWSIFITAKIEKGLEPSLQVILELFWSVNKMCNKFFHQIFCRLHNSLGSSRRFLFVKNASNSKVILFFPFPAQNHRRQQLEGNHMKRDPQTQTSGPVIESTPPPPLTLTSILSHHVFGFYLKEFCRAFVFRHLSVFRGGNNVTIGAVTRKMIVS